MTTRTADATWEGGLQDGNGSVSTESGALVDEAYSFVSRFEDGDASNPEELVAAAHAGCYSMALSAGLEDDGFNPNSVETTAEVTLGEDEDGPAITNIHLTAKADIDGIDEDTFQEHANAAKEGCPISKLYAGTEITLDAQLVQHASA
ncbi:MAG: OsmC family protein [bacterium]